MKEFFPVLHTAALFSGISDDELSTMLSCLGARIGTFPKGSRLLRAGDTVEEVGLVLAGSALIVQEDIWGNRNILSKTGPGQTFAEVFACAPGSVLNVSVEAESAVTVMFLHIRRVLTVCPSACSHHSRIIRNLLGELAEKNLRLNEKLTHMGQRTTRAKLMSYFSAEAQRRGGYEFDIPFSRQQLADYLGVERSGLSLELGKMRDEGLLDFHKSHFILKVCQLIQRTAITDKKQPRFFILFAHFAKGFYAQWLKMREAPLKFKRISVGPLSFSFLHFRAEIPKAFCGSGQSRCFNS